MSKKVDHGVEPGKYLKNYQRVLHRARWEMMQGDLQVYAGVEGKNWDLSPGFVGWKDGQDETGILSANGAKKSE